MVFMQADAALGAFRVGHAVVQLGGELVEADTVALEHHEQVVHHVGRLVAQMIDGRVVLGRQIDGQLVGLVDSAACRDRCRQRRARPRLHVLRRKRRLARLLHDLLQHPVGRAGEQTIGVALLPRLAPGCDSGGKRLERRPDLRRRRHFAGRDIGFLRHDAPPTKENRTGRTLFQRVPVRPPLAGRSRTRWRLRQIGRAHV